MATQHNTIEVGGVSLSPIEYRGQRVVTLAMIDKVHGRPKDTASRNFNKNRTRFLLAEDYFEIDQPGEIRRVGLAREDGSTPGKVILITETGYLMLVKSFRDDLAWTVQRMLVKAYFKVRASAEALEPRSWHELPLEERNTEIRTADAIGRYGNRALAFWYLTQQMRGVEFPRQLMPAWHQYGLRVPAQPAGLTLTVSIPPAA